MGQEASVFCSPSQPKGFQDRFDLPDLAACGGHTACGGKDMRKRMALATPEMLEEDKINAWTNDLGDHAECSSTLRVLSCGRTTKAPMEYLADMQGQGAIMLDSREGPMLLDDDAEDRVVGVDPGEVNMPAATARKGKALMEPAAMAARKGKALLEPAHPRSKKEKSVRLQVEQHGRGTANGMAA